MSLRSFLNNIFDKDEKQPSGTSQNEELLSSLLQEAREQTGSRHAQAKLSELETYQALKKQEQPFRISFMLFLLRKKGNKNHLDYREKHLISQLLSQLLRSKLHLSPEEMDRLLEVFIESRGISTYDWPYAPLLSQVEKFHQGTGLNSEQRQLLKKLCIKEITGVELLADKARINDRIHAILHRGAGGKEKIILPDDAIGQHLSTFIQENEALWTSLLPVLQQHGGKSAPPQKWYQQLQELLLGQEEHLTQRFGQCFETCIGLLKHLHREKSNKVDFLSENSIQIIRAMVWASAFLNQDILNNQIEELGLWCFKKLPGHGAVSVKIGNGTIYAFSILPFREGIARLTKYKTKIKYSSVQSLIKKTIKKVAEKEGKTPDEMEEEAVDGFGLTGHTYQKEIAGHQALIKIVSVQKTEITWEKPGGRIQKTVPAALKESSKEDIKHIKLKAKEIQSNLITQSIRLESFYLKDRVLTYAQWKAHYLDHPLMSYLTQQLVWTFQHAGEDLHLLPTGQGLQQHDGTLYEGDLTHHSVRLWHPIVSPVDEVENWRRHFIEHEVQQPFKQAFREIYLVTEAELATRSYSNRFAAHILRQHQFAALCQQRQWKYTLMGQWDSHNIPTINVPTLGIMVEFWVESDYENATTSEAGIFEYIFTDQVRFYDKERQLNMDEIPPLAFSELMRDVDLFVGVTSIGNDPNWTDNGEQRFQHYWSDYSFQELTESAKVRKATLKHIVPKLKIRNHCTFEDNYLVVEGKLRIYKIHLGSGNILMKPNDQYLCIVPDRKSKEKIFLPFEGDQMLSIILSKAFLLAEDEKITDSTILRQIE